MKTRCYFLLLTIVACLVFVGCDKCRGGDADCGENFLPQEELIVVE